MCQPLHSLSRLTSDSWADMFTSYTKAYQSHIHMFTHKKLLFKHSSMLITALSGGHQGATATSSEVLPAPAAPIAGY